MSGNLANYFVRFTAGAVIFSGGLLFSSCATLSAGRDASLPARILQHGVANTKVVILGDGVSAEAAEGAAQAAGAIVFYCPVRQVPRGDNKETRRTEVVSPFMQDVLAGLRAMTASGDYWEVAVAERARSQFRGALSTMRTGTLEGFRGKLLLSEKARGDDRFLGELRRVFGAKVIVGYIGLVTKE